MLQSKLFVSLLFLLLQMALAVPQHGPKTGPGYVVVTPLNEMDLRVIHGNASDPCHGFIAMEYSSPLPINETTCVASTNSKAPFHDLSCVARKKKNEAMDKCEMWGYLDSKCGGIPVIAGRHAPSGPWVWGLGTGETVDVKSFKVSC